MGVCFVFQEIHRLLILYCHNTNWIVPHMPVYYTEYTVMVSVKITSNIQSLKTINPTGIKI